MSSRFFAAAQFWFSRVLWAARYLVHEALETTRWPGLTYAQPNVIFTGTLQSDGQVQLIATDQLFADRGAETGV